MITFLDDFFTEAHCVVFHCVIFIICVFFIMFASTHIVPAIIRCHLFFVAFQTSCILLLFYLLLLRAVSSFYNIFQ